MIELDKLSLALTTALAIGAPPMYVNHVSTKNAQFEAEKVEKRIRDDINDKFNLIREDIKELKQDTKEVKKVLMEENKNA